MNERSSGARGQGIAMDEPSLGTDSLAGWMGPAPVEDGRNAARMLAALRERMFDHVDGAGRGLGRYRELTRIGQGGMGVVYRAWDPDLRRAVAIKVVRGDRTRDPDRLRREARAMAAIEHPNVVAVLDVGVHDGEVFVVMEFVDGGDLGAWCAAAPRTTDEILVVFRAAGRGLAAAHACGLVHRDFKPANALVGRDGRVRVTDFGLAAVLDRDARTGDDGRDPGAPTLWGGTPRYMAPEQRAGELVSHAADQYAFAVALDDALRTVPGGVPRRIAAALQRARSTDPAARFADMDALLVALERPRRGVLGRVALGGFAGATLVGLAVAGPLATDRAASTPECVLDDRLDALWSPSRRAAIGDAFAVAPAGAVIWPAVASDLDTWTARWIDAARPCPGPASEVACLEQQRSELARLLELFDHADADTVTRAATAVQSLPDPGTCAAATVDDERPARAVVDELLALTRTRWWTGHWTEAASLAADAVTQAQALGLPRATIDAEVELGRALMRTARLEDAAALLERTYLDAVAIDHGPGAFAAAVALVGLVPRVGRPADADTWIRHADTWQGRAAPTRAQRIELAIVTADAHRELARYGEAMASLEHAWALCDHDESSAWAPHIFNEMGMVRDDTHDLEGARDLFTRSVALQRSLGGDLHPQLAHPLGNLGRVYFELGDYARAEVQFEEAFRVREATAPNTPGAITALMNVGLAAGERHEDERALAILHDADARAVALLGEWNVLTAEVAENLAGTLLELDRLDEAEQQFARALEIRRRLVGSSHPTVARLEGALAAVRDRRGDYAGAEAGYRNALAILARHPEIASGLEVARTHRDLGLTLDHLERYDEAASEAELAVTLAREILGDAPRLAEYFTPLAQIALHRGRWDECIAACQMVLSLGPDTKLREGLAYFNQARARWRRDGARSRPEVLGLLAATEAAWSDRGEVGVAANLAVLAEFRRELDP
jgi:tetratricopeptide (TPR) repeat protein/predicted Ser/Thr protein kinase